MSSQDWPCQVLGVRGSAAQPNSAFRVYGGNSSAFLADCSEILAVFDAGSGLSKLSAYPHRCRPIHIFLSHIHIDHIIGFTSCQLLHDPKAVIHLYGESKEGVPLTQLLDRIIGPPYWPIHFSDFRARITVHEVLPGQHISLTDSVTLHTRRGRHPNGCLYYRLDYLDKSIVYLLDCEPDDNMMLSLAAFARNADLILWDANFTEEDFIPSWGHSTWRQGLRLRKAAGAKQVLMTHHNIQYEDEFLQQQEELCTAADPLSCFAKEGMKLML